MYWFSENHDEQRYKKQILDSDGDISGEFGRVGIAEIGEL